MLSALPSVSVVIGGGSFSARVRHDLAPVSCAQLEALTPLHCDVVHARWSGDAVWSPLAAVWLGPSLPPESATGYPIPGQILLFAGEQSEPELLIAYGSCRFASKAGPLEGNPVLTIDSR